MTSNTYIEVFAYCLILVDPLLQNRDGLKFKTVKLSEYLLARDT